MSADEPIKDPKAYLVDLESKRRIPIIPPFCSVGRHDSNAVVVPNDKSMSKQHFVITFEHGNYLIEDSNSSYGTYLNGNKLSEKTQLEDGDSVKAGNSMFWFMVGERELKLSAEFIQPKT